LRASVNLKFFYFEIREAIEQAIKAGKICEVSTLGAGDQARFRDYAVDARRVQNSIDRSTSDAIGPTIRAVLLVSLAELVRVHDVLGKRGEMVRD
jgi:hypothetical protein